MQSGPFLTTRRELLLGLAGAALASSKVRNSMYNPEIAAHTSIWVEEAALRNKRPADLVEEALAATRAAGYHRIELASEFLTPDAKDRTLRLLEKEKLEPSILFASGPFHTREAAEASRRQVKDMALAMMGRGVQLLNFSPAVKPNRQALTTEELDTEAYHLNRMGEDIRQAGLDLMVHHHDSEMRDNAREWRYLISHTEPPLVSFCLDVDWAARANMNPVSLVDTANYRLRAVHLRNPKKGEDQELLREGDIDMAAIARLLKQMQYDGFLVVELTHPKNAARQYALTQDLSLSRWYAQEVFGIRQGNPPVDMGPHVRLHPNA